MKTQGTFTNWNFTTTWEIDPDINDGYPHLQSNAPPVVDYYRSSTDGNWSEATNWQKSTDQLNWKPQLLHQQQEIHLGLRL